MEIPDKEELFRRALQEGIIKDPRWQRMLDDPLPLWAVLEITINMLETLNPPGGIFD